MASSRLRIGALSAVTTCMSTDSCWPSMPRGSRMPRASRRARSRSAADVDDRAAVVDRVLRRGGEHALRCRPRSTSCAAEVDGRAEGLAAEAAAREGDDQRFDRQPGHALGRVDREADRLLACVEVDDDAGLDAARPLVAEAEHLDVVGAARQHLGDRPRASAGR